MLLMIWLLYSIDSMSTGLRVRIKGWIGVGFWKWVTNDTDCGICRLPFDGCCPDCRVPGDDCPIGNSSLAPCFVALSLYEIK